MKITGIESRVIGYDIAEAWGGHHARGHPLDVVRVLVRHVPHRRGHRSATRCRTRTCATARAMVHVLHDLYAPAAHRRGPAGERGALAQAAAAEPPRLQPLGRRSPARSTSRSGTSAARSPGCRSRRCSAWPARRSRPTPRRATSTRRRSTSSRRRSERKAQGYHGFKIQFWDGLDRDIPRFRAAREAVGDDFPLMQDAAGMYTYTQAIAAGQGPRRASTTPGSRSRSPTGTCSSSSG